MGLIKQTLGQAGEAVKKEAGGLLGDVFGGAIADQWLEVLEPEAMDQHDLLVPAKAVRKEKKSTFGKQKNDNIVSNGSIIHVYDNQFMFLVDGGKIVDYSAEPGYYKVDNSSAPSMFNGEFKDTLKETFERFKYGGQPSHVQKVFYINTQEIRGIKFGTKVPINYYDSRLDVMLRIRSHGNYSIKVVNPIKFYQEVIPRAAITNETKVTMDEINDQYLSEFLTSFQTALGQYSADGFNIMLLSSKAKELTRYMRDDLDEDWNQNRGMVVQEVGVNGITFDEESQKLMDMRNQGAMLKDPTIQAGYMAGHVARGVEAAGGNEAGAMGGFIGMGMAMNNGGNIMGGYQQQAQQQQQYQQQQQPVQQPVQQQAQPAVVGAVSGSAGGWACDCGNGNNTGKFCNNCGKPKPAQADGWSCSCGAVNTGKFCQECGKPKELKCSQCGFAPTGDAPKFCPECGNKF